MNSAVIIASRRSVFAVSLLIAAALLPACPLCFAQSNEDRQPTWIWAPIKRAPNRAAGLCYFRKTFVVRTASRGHIELACDENYLLYVNGVKVASGGGTKMARYEIGPYLLRGRNVVAIEAVKNQVGPAGMAARVQLLGPRNEVFQMVTNQTWKTNLEKKPSWQQAGFIESGWLAAQEIGPYGATHPWIQPAGGVVDGRPSKPARFQVLREFRVEWVVRPKEAGSLIAMTFDEFGNIIASREGGPLLLIRDLDDDGIPEKVTTYCKQITNSQGILAMNGDVMVMADGPTGAGLYQLSDQDRDGVIDKIRHLVPFKGKMHEHGPHGLRLGPDGMIYAMIGNLARIETDIDPDSPYRHYYEGDLVQPRYEDPRGHANGVKAPGATILRIDPTGQHIERFAGGLRNPYDLAFNSEGELFTWDSDMEWDQGTSWYRPTRINHVVAGGEYGWRSGWAKWPDYFVDSLPAIDKTGNGSPTGIAVYDHFMYPRRYHGALFIGDWSQGQILVVQLKRQGASYTTETDVFLDGNPLNVTDMEIGSDGLLYFCTGGRGTEGGIYRVVWSGSVPPEVKDLGKGIEAALRQPQIQTAWARQRVAIIKRDLGDGWEQGLLKTINDRSQSVARRTRALDLLQLYGPYPSTSLLIELSNDRDDRVRARAAYLLGIHADDASVERLRQLVSDLDLVVKRTACESLVRTGTDDMPIKDLVQLLQNEDRHLAWAAAKALQTLPLDQWQELVLAATDQRTVLMGSSAILGTKPEREVCELVIHRVQTMMKGFVADREFIGLLRVVQLALHQGEIPPEDMTDLTRQLSREFPSGSSIINRELIRILAYLESPLVGERFLEQLTTELRLEDKTHLAAHAPHFVGGWSPDQRFHALKLLADVRNLANSPSHARYMDRVAQRFVGKMSPTEQMVVLEQGAKWPGAALGALSKLPANPSTKMLEHLLNLDQELAKRDNDSANRLRIGIAAVLARSGEEVAMTYLRARFEDEPERRGILAMGLAQHPGGENWPILLRSLPTLEGGMAAEVIGKLATVDRIPEDPETVRQVILQGLRQNNDAGRGRAIKLLEKWTGEFFAVPGDSETAVVAAWQGWFARTYPDLPVAELPKQADGDRYTFSELYEYLTSDEAEAIVPHAGRLVYTKAQCIKCHRFGDIGDGLGPDLTTISKRFQKKELLESIVYPSHVISDQYATKTVATTEGRLHSGVVHENADGSVVVLTSEGKQIELAADEIDEISTDRTSTMPSGLINELTLDEIAALFAFLGETPRTSVTKRPER